MDDEFVIFNSGQKSTWVTYKKNREWGPHWVYILECEGDKVYCGTTRNVIRRLVEHASNIGCRFTKKYAPLKLLHIEESPSYLDAINRETEIWNNLRKGRSISYIIMQEYVGLYEIIKELLSCHNRKWVLRKLYNIEREV